MKTYIIVHIHGFGMTIYYFKTPTPLSEEEMNSEETHKKLVEELGIEFDTEEYADENESLIVEEMEDLTTIKIVNL